MRFWATKLLKGDKKEEDENLGRKTIEREQK